MASTETTPKPLRDRPLSPHLGIYRFTLTMAMSIAHRITGIGLYIGVLLLAWFLVAASSDPTAVAALFHHMVGGIRHFLWDAGYGLDDPQREQLAQATLIGGFALSLIAWVIGYAAR